MTDERTQDPYRALQVDPGAHQVVIRAAYLALARRYHPDGDAPDPMRMADLNHAYELLRDEQRRRLYDARRAVFGSQNPGGSGSGTPMGPGFGGNGSVDGEARRAPVTAGGAAAARGASAPPDPETAGPFSRPRPSSGPPSSQLDFGRYTGWNLRDLARHDPDYLRWLSRHSSGLRYRTEILRLLPDTDGVGRDR
jgi:curved DNA-binding protein CbpA